MAGRWATEPDKHTKVVMTIGELLPNSDIFIIRRSIYYNDPRFGSLVARFGEGPLIQHLASKVGPDVLNDPPTAEMWLQRWRAYQQRHPNHQVSQAMFDQLLYACHGNYSRCETLFCCGIRPDRPLNTLSDNDLERLRIESLRIVRASYAVGGTTVKTYISMSGKMGGYQQYLQIYDRKTDPLGHPVVKNTFKDGRTSHWCSICQT
jgi:formamidopyrimidine-DNA glycosylase